MRAILTWHSIDRSGSPISVTPERFADEVAFLASGRVRVVPLAEIQRVPEAEDAVALTFDDAFLNFANEAWPALRDAGLPVTLFVVAGRCGADNRWGDREVPDIPTLPLLEWDALARLSEEGVELGGHSVNHPDLRTLSDEALREELSACREALRARTGVEAKSFAYPYGHWDERVRAAATEVFDRSVTTEHRLLRVGDDDSLLPRLDCFYFGKRGSLESFGSRGFARSIALRHGLRRVRALLRR